MSAPRLVGIGTAVPPHTITQADARAFARASFASRSDMGRLEAIFDRAAIERRHLVRPLEWFREPRSFAEKNAVYVREALTLAGTAASRALADSDVPRHEIGAVVWVSTTGVATPSLDAALVQALDVPRDVTRVPIFGLGCAGGGAGLDRARALARGLDAPVLLVCVEICSTTFVADDERKSNVVATALFADGAAAAVVVPASYPVDDDRRGVELIAGFSSLVDDSEHVMGWDVSDSGLVVRFSPEIPAVVAAHATSWMDRAGAAVGGSIDDLIAHPGGRRVLEAYETSLGWPRERLAVAWDTLARYGNMSSPTVLFALAQYLGRDASPGRRGLVLGLGPGFCAEGVVLRW